MSAPAFTPAPALAVGQPLDRADGRAKVTGAARYAAEFRPPGLAYGALVQSTVAAGRVADLDATAAEALPGVLGVLSRRNMPRLSHPPADLLGKGQPGEDYAPLQDDRVHWSGQHLAVVVAETPGAARHAASLVRVRYDEETDVPTPTRLEDAPEDADVEPELWAGREKLQVRRGGDVTAALAAGEGRIEAVYGTPVQNHQPIEMFSTTAHWEAPDRLTLHDTTRWVKGVQRVVAHAFGLAEEDVRAVCPFTGGAFGSKGFQWQHILLAAAAARLVNRPVRVEFTRAQMATTAGRRERTVQRLALGATRDGRLTALRHATRTASSPVVDYPEPCGNLSRNLYACPDVEVTHRLARLHHPSPCPMRAPGEAPGMFALECALDELAYDLHLDPLEVRLRNYAETDAHEKKPYSAKHLGACYRRAAERFGWMRRNPRPGATRVGDLLVGWGMATAAYPAKQMPAVARARLDADGRAVVRSATHEQGTGTYTAMTQLAADALGLPLDRVRFELGDSRFPPAPINGGSWLSSSVGPAVLAACAALTKRLTELAAADSDSSPLTGAKPEELTVAGGRVFRKGSDPTRGLTHAEVLARARLPLVEAEGGAKPGEDAERFAHLSFGAHFAEVAVDPDLGEVRLRRFVGCYDVGRVLNPKLARSQILGGIVFGLGMALQEGSWPDPRTGRTVNGNLAEYHVPVCADLPGDTEIDVSFVGENDPHFAGGFGAHGLGELGIVGSAAAVANAVFHATGVRVRELPITPDKLLL